MLFLSVPAFRFRLHYAVEIRESAALFLRLGVPSELFENALQTGEIWKGSFILQLGLPPVHALQTRGNLKKPALRVSVEGKHFENEAFR